ncbi:MAG: peptidoglycan editing factor PgeF [Gammaproteobacteria bacterium]|nr:peptidoglycan editing factor PgeF [Gammaproteobacteria bacterium]
MQKPADSSLINSHSDVLWADWPAAANIHALTTTRAGGLSQEPYAQLNLADHVGDALPLVEKNRQILAESLSIDQPLWLKQVHGVAVVDAATASHHAEADAVYTDKPATVCAVLTADCLPLLFCNRQASVVAAAHAGWRGLADGVIEATVTSMQQKPEDIMVWLGPAIGPSCFEVGSDVYHAFVSQDQQAARAFKQTDGEHFLADIYQLARIRLQRLGINQVYGGGLCTYSDEERFYSFRKNKITGRMASMIWISADQDQ